MATIPFALISSTKMIERAAVQAEIIEDGAAAQNMLKAAHFMGLGIWRKLAIVPLSGK